MTKKHLPYVKGLLIDDDREATTINNDHNLMISIVKVNYQKVQWQIPKPRSKWDIKNIKKDIFKESLRSNLMEAEEARVKNGVEFFPLFVRIKYHCSLIFHLHKKICKKKLLFES